MIEFLAMGGYAEYVWPAYIATGLGLSLAIIIPIYQHRKLMRNLLKRDSINNNINDES